jgi:hypothetical protein
MGTSLSNMGSQGSGILLPGTKKLDELMENQASIMKRMMENQAEEMRLLREEQDKARKKILRLPLIDKQMIHILKSLILKSSDSVSIIPLCSIIVPKD